MSCEHRSIVIWVYATPVEGRGQTDDQRHKLKLSFERGNLLEMINEVPISRRSKRTPSPGACIPCSFVRSFGRWWRSSKCAPVKAARFYLLAEVQFQTGSGRIRSGFASALQSARMPSNSRRRRGFRCASKRTNNHITSGSSRETGKGVRKTTFLTCSPRFYQASNKRPSWLQRVDWDSYRKRSSDFWARVACQELPRIREHIWSNLRCRRSPSRKREDVAADQRLRGRSRTKS